MAELSFALTKTLFRKTTTRPVKCKACCWEPVRNAWLRCLASSYNTLRGFTSQSHSIQCKPSTIIPSQLLNFIFCRLTILNSVIKYFLTFSAIFANFETCFLFSKSKNMISAETVWRWKWNDCDFFLDWRIIALFTSPSAPPNWRLWV